MFAETSKIEMAETFDTQLSHLHRKEAEADRTDYENRLAKAEDDYRQYTAFVEWVNARGGQCEAVIRRGAAESYVSAIGCKFWIDEKCGIVASEAECAEAWQIIWDMHQASKNPAT